MKDESASQGGNPLYSSRGAAPSGAAKGNAGLGFRRRFIGMFSCYGPSKNNYEIRVTAFRLVSVKVEKFNIRLTKLARVQSGRPALQQG